MHPQTKDKCHIIGHTLTLLLLMLKRHQREKNFVILYIHSSASYHIKLRLFDASSSLGSTAIGNPMINYKNENRIMRNLYIYTKVWASKNINFITTIDLNIKKTQTVI